MPREIEVKSILNKTKKRDSWFLDDYTLNLYSSCCFNCLYCYIRGSKYGANLARSLSVKTNAIELLDKQLSNRAKKNQYGIIVLSSATDPYLQVEKQYELTRQADSKTLMLKAIKKHYPELEDRYHRFFKDGSQMPAYYQKAFYEKMRELSAQYQISNRIIHALT